MSPSLDTLESVAAALGVPVARLLQAGKTRGLLPTRRPVRVQSDSRTANRCGRLNSPLASTIGPRFPEIHPCARTTKETF